MKIYTKRGDQGETSLLGGLAVPKDDLRIRAYGTFDELNATLAIVLSEDGLPEELRKRSLKIQGELFQLGAELATPRGKETGIRLISEGDVGFMEGEIDAMEKELKPLRTFILPGGTRASALFHFCRTVSRRAERELTSLNRSDPVRPVVLQYANRLSDYLFVCARYANFKANKIDVPWIAPKS